VERHLVDISDSSEVMRDVYTGTPPKSSHYIRLRGSGLFSVGYQICKRGAERSVPRDRRILRPRL